MKTRNLKTVENWAPAVLVYKNAIYHLSMGDQRIYRSTNPDADEWEEVEPAVDKYGDPALFQDMTVVFIYIMVAQIANLSKESK